jgi:hypothetical protein
MYLHEASSDIHALVVEKLAEVAPGDFGAGRPVEGGVSALNGGRPLAEPLPWPPFRGIGTTMRGRC